jgi:hypothetical protein
MNKMLHVFRTRWMNILKIYKQKSRKAYSSVAIQSQAKLWQANREKERNSIKHSGTVSTVLKCK